MFLALFFIVLSFLSYNLQTIHAGRTRVYYNALSPVLFDLLEDEAKMIAEYEKNLPSLKDDKRRTRWFADGSTPKIALEEAIVQLRKIIKPGKVSGCEWWVQKVAADSIIGFHLDKDESVASNKHYLSHPVYATILYLTDAGGATLIFDQYSPNGNGYEPEQPEEGELVFPKRNKYAIFTGNLLHGVIPGEKNATHERITFLMNWWKAKPEPPNCEILDYSQVPGLKTYDSSQLKKLRKKIKAEVDTVPKPKRESFPLVDLTPGSGVESYEFTFRLPGGAAAKTLLPRKTEAGKSYSIKWKHKQSGKYSNKKEL